MRQVFSLLRISAILARYGLNIRQVARLVRELEHLEPFGSGNRKPVFRCTGLRLQRPPTHLSGGAHLRFAFRGASRGNGNDTPALSREFVSFGKACPELKDRTLIVNGDGGADDISDLILAIGQSRDDRTHQNSRSNPCSL